MRKFWDDLFEMSGTKLKRITTYHPQTDGQTEVMNRGLEQYLRAFTSDKPSQWAILLCWAEFSCYSKYNNSSKMTRFQALYERQPPIIPSYIPRSSKLQAMD